GCCAAHALIENSTAAIVTHLIARIIRILVLAECYRLAGADGLRRPDGLIAPVVGGIARGEPHHDAGEGGHHDQQPPALGEAEQAARGEKGPDHAWWPQRAADMRSARR